MSLKKWLVSFFAAGAVTALAFIVFQTAVDPFGVFADKLLNWYDYDMTSNPRIAKIEYLDRNYEKYNSYIIGSSKTSSYPVSKLNEYYGGDTSFYNMLVYGGDLYDERQMAEYVIEHYNVKNIIINIGLEEACGYNAEVDPVKENLHAKLDGSNVPLFYAKYAVLNPEYAFNKLKAYARRDYLPTEDDCFISETGEFNKKVRDVEFVGSEEKYLEKNPSFTKDEGKMDMTDIDECVNAVKEIKEMCELKGITFKLIASPAYYTEIRRYDPLQVKEYYTKLANVTDFYDFSGYSDISFDSRYFYDSYHFRNCVGEMALAYMFNDTGIYRPENFGHITTAENVEEYVDKSFTEPLKRLDTALYTKDVPILMYHHILEGDNDNAMAISPELFESHLRALSQNGYTAISFEELRNYVAYGTPLPEKPVLITFDDGYLSNYEYAYPLLQKYGMKAAIFMVGVTTGASTYKNTGKEINPHFTYEQAKEMSDSGVIELGSHTYDLHRVEGLDEEYRLGASKKEGESDSEFAKVFKADIEKSCREIEDNTNKPVGVLSYPFGIHSTLTDVCSREIGIYATTTVEEGMNTVIKGIPQSLYALNRFGIYKETTPKALIEKIGG